jgi:diguanylate cyclase (GGDEF)-like protein
MFNPLKLLGQWSRFDAYPLEPYRDRIVAPLSLVSSVLLVPFTLDHVVDGRFLLAIVIGLAQIVLLLDGLALRRGARPPVPYEILVCALSCVVCASMLLQGINGAFWAYPTLFICYLILRRGIALAVSLALLLAVCVLALWTLGSGIAARLAATLALTLVMINVFLDVIEELQRALQRQAITDALTGAYNRRHLDTELQRMQGSASAEQRALLMIDVDHFKRINDTHGHAAGDEVLRRVSAEISARKRSEDMLFRTGGEEFILLLPSTDAAQAVTLAEALRERLAQSDVLAGERITVSIGVAAHLPGESIAHWAGRADAALYQAKNQGRNCVVCASNTASDASGGPGGNVAA